jgi:hypothetical protein
MKIFSIFFFFILFSENAATAVLDRDKFSVSNNSNFDVISPPCISQNDRYFKTSLFEELVNNKINITLNHRKLYKKMIQKWSLNDEDSVDSNDNTRNWKKYQSIKIELSDTGCILEGKLRLTGDGPDHFQFYTERRFKGLNPFNNPLFDTNFHSIKIKLDKGSIDNIERFKLFVLHSRGWEKEIITSHLFNRLGFLAPRSALIEVNVNGIKRRVIFQEDIDKNFLENNSISESLIFEGFENGPLGSPLSVPRVSNTRFISDKRMGKLAQEKYSLLTKTYLKSGFLNPEVNNQIDKTIFFTDPIVNPEFFDDRSKKEMILFSLMSFAINAVHGLSKDDSRFVYDNFTRRFRPIYYDGNSKIGDRVIHDTWGLPLQTKIVPIEFSQKHIDDLLLRINKINKSKFHSELESLGVNFNQEKIDLYLSIVESNLQSMITSKNIKNMIPKQNLYEEAMNTWNLVNKPINNIKETEFIVSNSQGDLLKCYSANKYNNCKNLKLKGDNLHILKSLLSQDLLNIDLDSSRDIFIGSNQKTTNIDTFNFKRVLFDELPSVSFFVSPNLNISINNQEKKITIYEKLNNKKSLEKQVLIQGGTIKDWQIEVLPSSVLGYKFSENSRYSKSNYTGCLTFSDLVLENVSIKMGKSNCEDSVHFMRVTGINLKVEIEDAYSDAIDSDFSTIHFDNVKINGAGNDCVDFSAGDYTIQYADLNNCIDKGVSVGEKSKVKISKIFLNNSSIGLVSKDSSILDVENFDIQNSKYCLAAYRKKNEFLGGIINFSLGDCEVNNQHGLFYEQEGSFLNFYTIED